MSIDTRARAAATELRATSRPSDPIALLADLHQARHRRSRRTVILTAAATVVVVGAVTGLVAHDQQARVDAPVIAPASSGSPSASPSEAWIWSCLGGLRQEPRGVHTVAGTSYLTVVLMNAGGYRCTMPGYPQVQFAGGGLASPQPVTPGDAPGSPPAEPFVLRDQQQASFVVAVPNPARFAPGACAPQRVTRLVNDANYDRAPLKWRTTICTGSQGRPYLTQLHTPSG